MKRKYILTAIMLPLILVALYFKDAIYFGWKLDKVENRLLAPDKVVSEIILINIGNGDRRYLAELINKVSECQLAVIALDAFFLKRKEKQSDSLLKTAIEKNHIVLAIKGNDNGNFYRSAPYFDRAAQNTGLAQLFTDFGLALSFIPQRQMKDPNKSILNHFSIAIANQYDPVKTKDFLSRTKLNQKYLINYSAINSNFLTYDYEDLNFNCLQIDGKIAILGYLGPEDEDKFKTPIGLEGVPVEYNQSKGDMYGATILANQVLMILNGDNLVEY